MPVDETSTITAALTESIREHIVDAGGALPWDRFMAMALYHPRWGYYRNGSQKFGRSGDFITAPEISPVFAQCLARQCAQVLLLLGESDIIEIGAGSGVLAADLLQALAKMDCLPTQYYILELSAELQQRQAETIKAHCPDLLPRVTWLQTLPTSMRGIVIGNEVLDAMPVHRFCWNDKTVYESMVTWKEDAFHFALQTTQNTDLQAAVTAIAQDLPQPYTSEINLALPAWIASLSAFLTQGIILLIDYGFPRHEYYHPQRDMGTLMCHYQHQAHDDPLQHVGLQDITAHVDFTAVVESAVAQGLDLAGYTTQAYFLLGCGIAEQKVMTEKERWQLNNAIKQLTLPSEMGELFKVIALSKAYDEPLLGFSWRDLSEKL